MKKIEKSEKVKIKEEKEEEERKKNYTGFPVARGKFIFLRNTSKTAEYWTFFFFGLH